MWLTEHRKKLVMRQLVALGMQTLGKCLQTCMCSKKPRESDSWVHMLKTDSVKSLDHTWYKGSKVQFPAYSIGQHPQSDLMESASPHLPLCLSHTHTHTPPRPPPPRPPPPVKLQSSSNSPTQCDFSHKWWFMSKLRIRRTEKHLLICSPLTRSHCHHWT